MDQSDFDELMRIQRMTLRSVANESEQEGKIKLMNIINEMMSIRRKRVQKENVMVEAQLQGMAESEVERTIDQLKSDRMIAVREGYIEVL